MRNDGPGAVRLRNGAVVRDSVGETTRFHYNGGEPRGKVRSLAADLSSGDEKKIGGNYVRKCLPSKREGAREKENKLRGRTTMGRFV